MSGFFRCKQKCMLSDFSCRTYKGHSLCILKRLRAGTHVTPRMQTEVIQWNPLRHMIQTLLKKGHYQSCENKRPSQSDSTQDCNRLPSWAALPVQPSTACDIHHCKESGLMLSWAMADPPTLNSEACNWTGEVRVD